MLFHQVVYFILAFAHLAGFALIVQSLIRTGQVRTMLPLFLFSALAGSITGVTLADILLHFLPVADSSRLYWVNELLEQGFAMALMVTTMRMALNGRRPAALIGQSLASVFMVVLAALLTQGAPSLSNKWMTGFTRNLSFGVALMNFYIWGLLIGSDCRSRKVFLMASGLGLLTTGKSLGHTVRISSGISGWVGFLGSYVVGITGVMAVFAWYFAVRTMPQEPTLSSRDGSRALPDGLGGVHHQPAQSAQQIEHAHEVHASRHAAQHLG